jgi:2-keto-3-deoxy-L-rhamnonate aldolase RhmA
MNGTLAKLRNGDVAFGVGLRQARTVDIAKMMRAVGFDWLFIDLEHNAMSVDTASQIAVAAQDNGITPIVRVPGAGAFHVARALDGGAWGVVAPHIDTVEEARALVGAARYPPLGRRSVAYGLPHFDFAPLSIAETVHRLNDETLVVAMIETPEAVSNAAAIAAVQGIDVLLVGTQDLALEMGRPGETGTPELFEAFALVSEACRQSGKIVGLGGTYDPALVRRYIELGARMIQSGGDVGLLMDGASRRLAKLRGAADEALPRSRIRPVAGAAR